MEEAVVPEARRPSMPAALTLLYLIAGAAAFAAVVGASIIADDVGYPAAALPTGYLVGAAIGAFVPALATHAIIAAIYNLRWNGVSSLP